MDIDNVGLLQVPFSDNDSGLLISRRNILQRALALSTVGIVIALGELMGLSNSDTRPSSAAGQLHPANEHSDADTFLEATLHVVMS